MSSSVNYKPNDYNHITPYLIAKEARKALEFYKKVLGAEVVMCMDGPDNRIMHSELRIGDSKFMLADECEEAHAKSPASYGGSPVGLYVYVPNVDEVAKLAEKEGATITRPLENQFYGDRTCTFTDPFGHIWSIGTHIEDVSEEETQRRMEKMMKEQSSK
ncbi:VOC family protein [Legionella sp. 16cNR16C]|uniref:VOC family protein n=1 Tax=Legionella sp. 16cNR16C TaxID=2905656 RepID=UPI001E51A4AB|nr:VOC family protein [Legionella sp. 16cNR16C]MCE3045894.1 VOC family protein [Legionella sp. 16cNR16C]